jgi:hypothetical protein
MTMTTADRDRPADLLFWLANGSCGPYTGRALRQR